LTFDTLNAAKVKKYVSGDN